MTDQPVPGVKVFPGLGETPELAAEQAEIAANKWLQQHLWLAADGRPAYTLESTITAFKLDQHTIHFAFVLTLLGPIDASTA